MPRVFIGVGSNEGDRFANISGAARWLSLTAGIRLTQMAPIIETKPVGGPPQDDYLNTVIEVQTELSAQDLLTRLQEIEKQLGRKPSAQRWGPRPIDLDILLYDDAVIQTERLSIPHPRLHERFFALQPLAELAPELIHPALNKPIRRLLEEAHVSAHSISQ